MRNIDAKLNSKRDDLAKSNGKYELKPLLKRTNFSYVNELLSQSPFQNGEKQISDINDDLIRSGKIFHIINEALGINIKRESGEEEFTSDLERFNDAMASLKAVGMSQLIYFEELEAIDINMLNLQLSEYQKYLLKFKAIQV